MISGFASATLQQKSALSRPLEGRALSVSSTTAATAISTWTSVVTRVVDYEPPALASEPCAPPTPTTLRRTATRVRPLHAPHPVVEAPPSQRLRSAGGFADAALRGVLEVLDRRRPATHLRPLLAGGLADAVTSFHRTATTQVAAAVLRRVRLQPTDRREQAFEVTATYSRGSRLHAIACRIDLVPDAPGDRWQVTALHIG